MAVCKFTNNYYNNSFPIANIFIDKYMPIANATFVKVYLYGLRLCFVNNNEIQNKEIAKKLDILESDVVKAWLYWEENGVVKLVRSDKNYANDFDVEFVDLASSSPQNTKEKHPIAIDTHPCYSPEEISIYIDQNENIRYMYKYYEQKTGKPLSASDINTLYSLYDWLRLPVEVIIMLIEYCSSINKLNMRYMEKVAINWADQGINTIEKTEDHLVKLQSNNLALNKIRKALGLSDRNFTESETKYINEWTVNMGLSTELIQQAYELTIMNTGKLSFPYINTILVSWCDRGIKTVEQAVADVKNFKESSKNKYANKNTASTGKNATNPVKNNNKFNNFKQRTRDFEELERLAQKNNLNS